MDLRIIPMDLEPLLATCVISVFQFKFPSVMYSQKNCFFYLIRRNITIVFYKLKSVGNPLQIYQGKRRRVVFSLKPKWLSKRICKLITIDYR